MAWIQIQHAARATWDEYERVSALMGDRKPDGLVVRAVGEVDGRWKAVSIWESKEAFERFAMDHVLPALKEAFGDELVPEPHATEWFEAKSVIGA